MARNARRGMAVGAMALLAAGLGAAGFRLDWWGSPPRRIATPFSFADGFEDALAVADLFPRDGSRWHGRQCEAGAHAGENRVELTAAPVHSGTQALRFVAAPYDGRTASKADIVLGNLHFVKGDDVWFSGWFWLAAAESVADVFLWDLESEAHRGSPGRRLYLQAGGGIASDLGKWHRGATFRQSREHSVPFPVQRWVRLRLHLHLSAADDGRLRVWQDERLVLDAQGQTLPTAKTVYSRLQVGLTANGNRICTQTLVVDDVVLSNRPLD